LKKLLKVSFDTQINMEHEQHKIIPNGSYFIKYI